MTEIKMEDKIKGSLLGLVWGDVLGCPVETWKENDIKNIYDDYNSLPLNYPIEEIKKWDSSRIRRLRPLGLYSDDGQQALALINTCLNEKGFHQMNWRNMLVTGMDKHAWRGIGGFFTKAVYRMKNGTRTDQSGSFSAGIGSAMRIGPLGSLYKDDLEELRKVSLQSSLMTHADIRAATFSYIVSYVVYCFVNNKNINEIVSSLSLEAEKTENEILNNYKNWNIDTSGKNQVSKALKQLLSEPVKDINLKRKEISDFAKPYLAKGFTKAHPNQGFVLTGGIHALCVALQEQIINPNDELLDIIKMGYDTDTVAAIAGSILGARFGCSFIEEDKIMELDRINKYATALIEKLNQPETMQEFISNEEKLTKMEINFQNNIKKSAKC